jgi:hypothetical protein
VAWDATSGQPLPDAPARLPSANRDATSPDGKLRLSILDGRMCVVFVEAHKRRLAGDRALLQRLAR